MIRTECRKGTFAVAAVTLLLAATAQAGPIFLAGQMEDGKFVPNKDVKAPFYTIDFSAITATIDGDAVRTEIRETIAGPDKAVRAVCLVPLPPGATATWHLPDRSATPRAKLLAPDEAQKLYEAIARASGSVAILSLTGRAALMADEVQLKGKTEVVIRVTQKARLDGGVRSVVCPTPAAGWARGPVGRLSVKATIRSREPLRAIFSPTHQAAIERSGLNEAVVRVRADRWGGGEDFRLCWVADRDPLGLRVIAYRDEADDEGYFMLVGNPTGSDDEKPVAKDVLFVLDTSGSMRGEKVEQARAAIDYCLGRLNGADRFNVITFGTEASSFRDGPVGKTEANLSTAREFVESVVAKGRTNIGGALAKALAGRAEKGRPRIMIFLTDGTPTAGELVPEKIVDAVKQAGTATQIFVMGVGHDVNAHLLDKLAEVTNGSSEYVEPTEEIDVKVAALYDRLSQPVLANVEVAFGELRPGSVYPKKLPALFRGSDIMVFGRYREGGSYTFTVSGTLAGKPVAYTCRAALPAEPAGKDNEFVAPLWAARKIGYLLQEIRLHGENKELTEEVVRLSRKYGIVTEYTEFIAAAGGDMDKAAAMREATRRMEQANHQQAGQWAVNQARNDRGLQTRMVATDEGNFFVDRRGRRVANDAIRNLGRRVFYLRDGQWVDAEAAEKRKVRTVKLYSEEYFKLLRNNRDFSRAQRLSWAVAMNVGDERIVVEKDGKQKDERLQREPPPQEDRQIGPDQRLRNQIQVQQIRNQVQQAPQRRNDANQAKEEPK